MATPSSNSGPSAGGGLNPSPPQKLTATQWLILIIAAIGFAFDIYELLMLPLILRPALTELGFMPGTPEFSLWAGRLFYLPAFAGGLFGLLGGYLTDRLGRRRVLTWSILLYAFSAFAAGFSTSVEMLLFLRSTTFIGVCIEFVAAVAWLAELFPNPHQRENMLGYTQAFSSIGGLLVAGANSLALVLATQNADGTFSLPAIVMPNFLIDFGFEIPVRATLIVAVSLFGILLFMVFRGSDRFTAYLMLVLAFLVDILLFRFVDGADAIAGLGAIANARQHEAWRYTLMSGIIPALPLIIIRPFLPESPVWAKKKSEGTLKRPSLAALFSLEFRRTTLVTTIMFACSYGAAFGAIQQMPQIVPGLPEVKEIATAKGAADREKAQKKASEEGKQLTESTLEKITDVAQKGTFQTVAADVTKVQEIGGLLGRFLLAILAVRIVSRRSLLRVFQVPGLIILPIVFAVFAVQSLNLLYIGIFFAGLFTVAQFSFWGNYLPRVYPVHLRGTGESFAANIGGRMIGTSFAWITQSLAVMPFIPGDSPPMKVAYTAAGVAFFVYLVGSIACFFLPEPGEETIQE